MYILNVLFTYLPVLNNITYALQSRYAAALSGEPSKIRQQRGISGGRPSFYAEIALDGATIVEFSDSFEAD